MAGNIYAWSQTAASNGSSDSTINFAEGQLPGTLNDSDRAAMAVHASYLADNNATTTTGGTGAAYSAASGLSPPALATGLRLRLKMNVVNTGACTLTLTPAGGAAFAAKAIRTFIGAESDPAPGQLQANGIYEFNYDAAANSAAGAWILLNPSTLALAQPGGRLTLTSATPVLIANATAQGNVYYTPYLTSLVPINGTIRTFTEQSVALDATNFLSGKLYDFFMFDNAGTPTLGYGPAWTHLTTRSTAIARAQGIWTNNLSITLRTNSSTTFTLGTNAATYFGT